MQKMSPVAKHKSYKATNTGIFTGFKCVNCSNDKAAVAPKFKINVRVIDSTGCATFILWDKDVKTLIHRTALELRQKQADNLLENPDVDDKGAYPVEIDAMLNKMCLFKLEISPSNNNNFSSGIKVAKMTDDPDILNEFMMIHKQEMPEGSSALLATPKGNTAAKGEEPKIIVSQSGDTDTSEELVRMKSSSMDKQKGQGCNDPPPSVQSTNIRKRKIILEDDDESEE
ncbi:OLC1v1018696C1 [Oldenlandia corymbosa var. corymbosa]|uniref:OLC1v1018696C1 n=1 Tax=Oldenlandia corymbosa var. corymbosa TaxID=529605 RepID=A0AAV1ECB3_OLDCO|nr:OLC1v1018696C1 [Oldenlandia corymbosa var. corymbosa]